jgi:ABC-2 type transport system permease protein
MLNRALLKKSIHDSKWLLLGCAVWLVAFGWVRVWIISRMERSRFESILEQLGDLVQTASPVAISHLVSFTGRVAVGYDEALVVFVVLAFAISRGSDVVSGELGRGSLEMLLAQPVSRFQVLASQGLVTVAALAILAFSTWLGSYVGVQTTTAPIERTPVIRAPFGIRIPIPFAEPEIERVPMRTQVDVQHLAPGAVNLFCLGYFFAGLSTFLSACDRYRWRTIGLAIAFLVLQTVAKVIGRLVDNWQWLEFTSIFTAYEPQRLIEIAVNSPDYAWSLFAPLEGGGYAWGPLAYHGVLVVLGTVGYLAAAVVFTKRDLPAPL